MLVHLFRGPGRIFAITKVLGGANLPSKYAPWAFLKSIELQPGIPTPGVNVDECLNDLAANGLHVTDAHVRITEQAMS